MTPRSQLQKGKPVARQGRKARGLPLGDGSAASLVKTESISTFKGVCQMSVAITRFAVMRYLFAAVAALLGLTAFSSAAQAACSYPDAEQVFAKWGDARYYQLAPDGGFEEGGTGWSFTGGAHLVAGNESAYLNGEADDMSLSLPYKGTATSPRFCVDENTPVFRLMTLNAGASPAKLRVIVTYETPVLKTRNTDIRAEDEWAPTQPLQLDVDGAQERVARISFTPRDGTGEWLLDDLYIDPFARR